MSEDTLQVCGRRQMLSTAARSVAAIAVIAATAVPLKSAPAEARDREDSNGEDTNDKESNDKDSKGKDSEGGENGPNCFLKGTLIGTPGGPRKIEDLASGDLVNTLSGAIRPIQFLSACSYRKSDPSRDWVADVMPVLIRKSAISDNVPNRDLYLTRLHCLYLDGMLVPVGDLINGKTIALWRAEHLSELAYFHVKLESHDLIYAEGVPCESLLGISEDAKNFADYYRAHGFPGTKEQPYAPVHSSHRGRSEEVASRLRSAMSAIKECRRPYDILRDRLETRAASLVG